MLTPESSRILSDLFFMRKVPYRGRTKTIRKYAIPIGVNELVVRKVEDGFTKHGKRMVTLTLWKEPTDEVYCKQAKDKVSFAPVVTYHPVGEGSIRHFYRGFAPMTNEALDKLLEFKGKRFLGVVKHTEKELVKGGQIVRSPMGEKITYWTQSIVGVYPLGIDVEVDYFQMVERVVKDTRITDEFVASLC